MIGGRHQAPKRQQGKSGSSGGERKVGETMQQEAPYGDWQQLQRSMGNRMVGNLLQRSVLRNSAASPAAVIQRAPGLPTKQELQGEGLKSGKKAFGKTSWGKLEEALAAYEKLGDTDYPAQEELMKQIEVIIGDWKASYDKRKTKKKQDEAKLTKVEHILDRIRQRRMAIQEAEAPPSVGREVRRRAEAFRGAPVPVLKQEEKKQEKSDVLKLREYLEGNSYSDDGRNYLSWGVGEIKHVSWKAHVGSADAVERLAMAKAVSPRLRSWDVYHKFDISETEGPIGKFLTVYPPKEDGDWAHIVTMLENAVSGFAPVEVEGDMPVGETGQVHMRHGQNTPLTPAMLKDVQGVEQKGQLGEYPRYVGEAVQGQGLPLLLEMKKGILFFSKTLKAPPQLSNQHIYMAILVDGRIVPDKREEPNPANVLLPTGVKEFERKKQ
ncbi:hypothetical protein [Paenibacillus sp.]|uniref:hypothetical protein n=1 Tax=Paenibacillus sp. TaxID=58172 RepID=UPI002810AE69|nr:hypothetical protein [Paenibacillus sp.]